MTGDPLDRLRAADPLGGELPAPLGRMPRPDREPVTPSRRWDRVLVVANLALLAAVLLHGVDHAVIQERGIEGVSFEVILGGFMITAVSLVSLTVALRRYRRASLVALLAGPWIAAAIILGHFVPYWGEFSDPYKDAGLEPISYVLAAAAAAAGLALAAVALAAALSPAARTSAT